MSKCYFSRSGRKFIEFMLKMVNEVLDGLIEGVNNQINHVSAYVKKIA